MSILHGISAAILKNVSSVKKQASRLHKSSERIFGQQHSLSQCQEAVAVANGFRSWSDVMNVAKRFSSSNEEPFWYLTERNDFQEKYLKAILQTRLSEVCTNPLLITGDLKEAAELGTAQWFERMSFEKLPGLMLVDTKQKHLEDTFVGKSITQMQIADVMMRCRVIDAREKVPNVAITANAHELKHIPTILIFDSDDVASSLLAGVVLQMYERLHIPADLTAQEERQRPILFYTEHQSPRLISRYVGHGTIFVSSALNRESPLWKENGVFNLLVAEAMDGYVSYAGRKIMVD